MPQVIRILLAGFITAGACMNSVAQSVDESLLAAQMAYQQANSQVTDALAQVNQAQEEKRRADKQLTDAQSAVKLSTEHLAEAESRLEAARAKLALVGEQLAKAWASKEAQVLPVAR